MGSKKYVCPFCQKPYETAVGRASHVRRTHKNGQSGKRHGPIKKPKDK